MCMENKILAKITNHFPSVIPLCSWSLECVLFISNEGSTRIEFDSAGRMSWLLWYSWLNWAGQLSWMRWDNDGRVSMLKGYLTNRAISVTEPGHHKIKALVVYTAYKEQKGTTMHTRYKKILKKYEISSKLFLPFKPFYCFELYLLMMVLFQIDDEYWQRHSFRKTMLVVILC